MLYQELTAVFLLLLLNITGLTLGHAEKPLLLLISFDGFRWDYLNTYKNVTPTLHQLIANGVTAKAGLQNAFTTVTFPNHMSIISGLYEESHGVVGNEMYDPALKRNFSMRRVEDNLESVWFEDTPGEPLWVTNQKQSSLHRSGVYQWPGSVAEIKGYRPYYFKHYNGSVPLKERIDTVIDWFVKPDNDINLGVLYWNEPDHTGHKVGPSGPELEKAIAHIDTSVKYMIEQMKSKKLYKDLNIVITSDHGMAAVPPNQWIDLDKFVDPSLYSIYEPGVAAGVLPKPGKLDEVYNGFLNKHPHLHVYKKEDIPERWHYKHNRRIMPILLVADVGWMFWSNSTGTKWNKLVGSHGYNNSEPSMHPIFLAHGPAFKKGYAVQTFNNVDIYPLLCEVLKLKPATNNGSLATVKTLLKDKGLILQFNITYITFIVAVLLCATVAGVFSIATIRQTRMHTRRRMFLNVDPESAAPLINDEESAADDDIVVEGQGQIQNNG